MKFDYEYLIICKPELMNNKQEVGEVITFLLFWIMFFYLLAPLSITTVSAVLTHIFHATMYLDAVFWAEVIEPVYVFMLIVLATVIALPFWIVFKSVSQSKHKTGVSLSQIEKVIVPGSSKAPKPSLSIEIILPMLDASKITCYFNNESNINGVNLDGSMIAVEGSKARPEPHSEPKSLITYTQINMNTCFKFPWC